MKCPSHIALNVSLVFGALFAIVTSAHSFTLDSPDEGEIDPRAEFVASGKATAQAEGVEITVELLHFGDTSAPNASYFGGVIRTKIGTVNGFEMWNTPNADKFTPMGLEGNRWPEKDDAAAGANWDMVIRLVEPGTPNFNRLDVMDDAP